MLLIKNTKALKNDLSTFSVQTFTRMLQLPFIVLTAITNQVGTGEIVLSFAFAQP